MLSTDTRIRLENIANRIALGESVNLDEMIWAEKWSKHNRSAAGIMRQARRRASTGETHPDSLDTFMNAMDLGDPDPANHHTGPMSPDELTNFFKSRDDEEWLQRD